MLQLKTPQTLQGYIPGGRACPNCAIFANGQTVIRSGVPLGPRRPVCVTWEQKPLHDDGKPDRYADGILRPPIRAARSRQAFILGMISRSAPAVTSLGFLTSESGAASFSVEERKNLSSTSSERQRPEPLYPDCHDILFLDANIETLRSADCTAALYQKLAERCLAPFRQPSGL